MIVQQIPSFQVLCVDLPEKKRNNPRHNRDFLLGIKEESTTGIVLKILECSAKGQDSQESFDFGHPSF